MYLYSNSLINKITLNLLLVIVLYENIIAKSDSDVDTDELGPYELVSVINK